METRRKARRRIRLEHGKISVSEDRLNNLPESLVHNVLSRLPSRSLAFMSTLSKKWEYILESFPEVYFDEREFKFRYENCERNDIRFFDFMNKYSLRQRPILIQKIRICISSLQFREINHQVDKFMNLVKTSEIRELILNLRHTHVTHRLRQKQCCYSIPKKVFSLGSHLTLLKLKGCRFKDLGSVNVPLLKSICLTDVRISEDTFLKLVISCPSLENLVLQYCFGLSRIRIVHPSLERLVLTYCIHLEAFYLDCPLLQYLECAANNYEVENYLEISGVWISCSALRYLKFERVNLGAEACEHLMSASPLLESLTMISCQVERPVKVCGEELKHVELEDTDLPQLVKGSSIVESFSVRRNVYNRVQTESIAADYEILCSMLMKMVHLKSLCLERIVLPSDESLEFFISICPFLNNLCLVYCHNVKRLRIISKTLKTLSITSYSGEEPECQLWAPNIISFKFKGFLIQFFRVVVSYDLVAELKIYSSMRSSKWVSYIRMFNEARKLTLTNRFSEYVLTPDQAAAPSSQYHRQMKASVNVEKKCWDDNLLGIADISSCCTSLTINFDLPSIIPFAGPSAVLDLKFLDHYHHGVIVLPYEHPDCIEDHLHEMNVDMRKECAQAMVFLEFVLGKAIHLRKLLVFISCQLSAEIRSTIISRITAMKKVSQGCKMIFCSSDI